MDTSTDRAALAEAIRSSLAAAVPNSNGVIWEHQHEDGQREPVTIDALTGMVMQHVEKARSPRPATASDEAVEAAAREQWMQEHGQIASHDSDRTPESDEREKAESGYRDWDSGRVAEPVKAAYRRRARAVLEAAHLTTQPADVDHLAALIEAHPRYERLDGVVFCQHAGGYQHWGPGYDGYARHLAEVLADSVQPADVSDEQVNAGAEALTAYHGEPNYPGEHHADARRVLTAAQPADVDHMVREAEERLVERIVDRIEQTAAVGSEESLWCGGMREAAAIARSVRDEGGERDA